jgi:hypothetical protein
MANSEQIWSLYWIRCWSGEIEDHIFDTILWKAWENLKDYDFLEGDAPFISQEWKTGRSDPH